MARGKHSKKNKKTYRLIQFLLIIVIIVAVIYIYKYIVDKSNAQKETELLNYIEVDKTEVTKQKTERMLQVSELKKENLNLKSLLQKLKDKFYFIKHFIITKILDYKEKDKYVQLTRDLYEHRGLDEDDYKELINFSKPINSSRDYITKEKDDYER